MTQERVMGSLRSSMYQLNIAGEAASSKVSNFKVSSLQSYRVSTAALAECGGISLLYIATLKR
jgi:hypothetical protein